MRWSDLYLGLIALTLGFGALVTGLEGAPWYVPGMLVAFALLALAWTAARWSTAPAVALVGDPRGGRLIHLHDALEDEGFEVRACVGPALRACPVTQGRPCPLANGFVAAVVSKSASYLGAAPPCGKALGVSVITVDERSAHEPFFGRRSAYVGGSLGPVAAAETVHGVVERNAV